MAAVRDGLSFSIEKILSPDFGHRRWDKLDSHLHQQSRVSTWLEQLKRTKRVLSTPPDECSILKRGFFPPEERWISSTSSECSTPDPIKRPDTWSPDSNTTPKRPSSSDPLTPSPSPKRRTSLDKDFFCSNPHHPPSSPSGSRSSPDSSVGSSSPPEQKPAIEKKEGEVKEKKNNGDSAISSGKDLLLNGSDKWPVWVYCNRYSPRPSSGPRSRRQSRKSSTSSSLDAEKRCRTAFSGAQLSRLREEFQSSPYLSESRRSALAAALQLSEAQVKIWFQNMRAKLKRSCREKDPLAMKLMEQGLYNHSTNKE